jgi:hypothetical protein
MEDYRIITHFSEGLEKQEPWNAFFFEPEEHGLSSDVKPIDFIAELCGHLEAVGQLTTGQTESQAVARLFLQKENEGHLTDNHTIFEKHSGFK